MKWGNGRLLERTLVNGKRETFNYDTLGRLTSHTRIIDSRSYTMGYGNFDALNRPRTITYPNGEAVTMTYDREGEQTLRAGADLLVDNVTYNARGQMARLERANGLDTVLSYYGATGAAGTGNSNFRLSNITSGGLINLSYTYDKVGNIKTIGDNLIGNTQTFGYDHLNRLTTAPAPAAGSVPDYNHSYAYNQIGNITSFAGTTYAYNDAAHKHAVTHLGGVQKFWYDANGNMTKRIDGSVTYDPQVYDVENRLISVNKVGTGTTAFAYDASGQRVKTIEPGGKTTYTPFAGYEEEVNGSTTTRRTTYAIAGQAVAVRVQIVGGSNTLYYLFNDHLGSSSVLSNSSGVKISGSEARYLPFGGYRTTPATNPSVTDRGFTGQKHNDSLGLIYYNARFYAPSLGRFLSADTIVPNPTNPQSLNRYSYTRNSPLNLVDPTGHRECGASDECSDPLPHSSGFQDALINAWMFYKDNFDMPFEGEQNLSQDFGKTEWEEYHNGADWSGNFTVRAPFPGMVTEAGLDQPAGRWRLRSATDPTVKRQWLRLKEKNRDEIDGLLEPERLLATGEWIDDAPGWSHTQGTVIKIDHGNNLETVYYHTNPSIAAGTTVDQGEALGVTANNGWSTGTHLHYTVNFTYNGGSKPLNPLAPPASIQHLLTP